MNGLGLQGEVLKGDEYNAYCPSCQPNGSGSGRDKHLYYKFNGEKVLLHCKHGCSFDDVIKYLKPTKKTQLTKWEVLREHIYYNSDGSIFGKKTYYKIDGKKSPIWYLYENGKYEIGLKGKKSPLYNLLGLQSADETEPVYLVEGEKDVDNMCKQGLLAVSPPNGANYWQNNFNNFFRDRNVIIIPDNDEPGKKHLEKVCTNLRKFAKTVRTVDLTDIVPELKKGGDISDVFEELKDGKEMLLQLVIESESHQTKNHDIQFVLNDKGNPKHTLYNFRQLLQYYNIEVKYNSIFGIEFDGKLPNASDENAMEVYFTYIYDLAQETEAKFSNDEIANYLMSVADSNYYNPIVKYLEGLSPSKGEAIKEYFKCLQIEDTENINFYYTLFCKWLIQCIAMVYNNAKDPYGSEGAIGLQCTKEGIGKTTFFKHLVEFDKRYFKDSVSLDSKNCDSIVKATSYWISELGEVESTLNKDLPALKACMTEMTDVYRLPYARANTTKPRRTSFCFTCNSEKFLKDGDNRRFWTIPVVDVDLTKLLKINVNEVWYEAYLLYKQNTQGFRLTRTEIEQLKALNLEKFSYQQNEETVLRDMLNFETDIWRYYSSSDISELIFGNKQYCRAIGKILNEKLGYTDDISKQRHFKILHGIKKYHLPLLTSMTNC